MRSSQDRRTATSTLTGGGRSRSPLQPRARAVAPLRTVLPFQGNTDAAERGTRTIMARNQDEGSVPLTALLVEIHGCVAGGFGRRTGS